MNAAIGAAGAVLAGSSMVSGASLLPTRAKVSGAALMTFGALVVVSALIWARYPSLGSSLFVLAWALGLGWALLSFPTPVWSDPVVLVTSCVVLGAGMTLAATSRSIGPLTVCAVLAGVAFIANLMWRYDHAEERDRLAMLWMGLAVEVAGLAAGHSAFLLSSTAARVVALVMCSLVPFALVLGVRSPTIVDVRGLIIEALVFEVVVVAYVTLFVGIASTIELFGSGQLKTGALAVIAAVAAAGFHPLRSRLRSVIDELLFGVRPDPLDAATQVAAQAVDDPVAALAAVRDAMVLPFASLVVDGNELARSGTEVPHTRRLSLGLGNDSVGEIVVGLRPGDLQLSSADERVLRIVAPLLAQTVRARSLAADLQTSRGGAIAAIEEERRRFRRDLHDGLGPTLSGIAFTADAARNSLGDPSTADELLRTVRAEASNAIDEIRRLVYAMRPPALDELGLVGALGQFAQHMRMPDGSPFRVVLTADEAIGQLPAAVEVAAYRITVEALANAALHSGSNHAEVDVHGRGPNLVLEIRDHGRGRCRWIPGVGLTSMIERATEIGGTVSATSTDAGGSVVASLPRHF